MRWRRKTNFHNSRTYDDEAQRAMVVSQARLTFAWLIDAALRKFRRATRPEPARPSEMIVVRLGNGRGFTVLGSAIAHHAVHESAMTCPFPEQDEASALLRASRSSAAASAHHRKRRSASHSPSCSSEL
jgi:hypothetical protein